MGEVENYYHNSRPEIASLVPVTVRKILDVGTGQGNFLKLMKEQNGCETWGVEMVSQMAEVAKGKADKILIGKVEDVIDLIPDGYFDCITFNDVLEHTLEPWDILKIVKPKLAANGLIIASIPNVRHITNLAGMLKGNWDYTDYGILDSTHLRFFTKKSMRKLFQNAGYELKDQFGINEVKTWKFKLFNIVSIGLFDDTKYLQFVCMAKKP